MQPCYAEINPISDSDSTPQKMIRYRERISINKGWKFMRYAGEPDKLIYDERPVVTHNSDNSVADTRASESGFAGSSENVLKKWILPTANDFIKDASKHYQRPAGNPGRDFLYVQNNFNDDKWQVVDLPHDWAIKEPFYEGENAIIGGGMGRLPIQGVTWYRRKINIPSFDTSKSIYLDVDGAMSYAMVWLNGNLVGGWPYGYNSFRLDLTAFIKPGDDNQLAIRLDNPVHSSRWYPGGGIYRNVWLTKVSPVHVAQWGTFITTKNVSAASAVVDIVVQVENKSKARQAIKTITEIYTLNDKTGTAGDKIAVFPKREATIEAEKKIDIKSAVTLKCPRLWGPLPVQKPNLYIAVTKLYANGQLLDEYKTQFGIRSVQFDPLKGIVVNGKLLRVQGVNQHHDLGSLGAAFNRRAAERQLEILQQAGCNAIRMAHNPPAPELLELTDRMGFLVIDELFDCWEKGKNSLDFHLIFNDWYEADTRSFVRRDRNHPSVIAWSFGNEVGEQYTEQAGAATAKRLHDIVRDEDSTRPATASINFATSDMPFSEVMDIINLNYRGEGIRDAPAYSHLKGIRTSPSYPAFHKKFPAKLILSSETASTLSTRGTYIFPVYNGISAPVSDSTGGDPLNNYVSGYDLYTAQFGASPDKVFKAQDQNLFVAGEFVWTGWDYIGEPTPYYTARSSYSGFIDLAGFKKDRFYLYQSRWRPELPMAHILPHWTWPDRIGKITPVHVYSSGDEAELFLNNQSLGRKKRGQYEYRFRWDSIVYSPGELKVVTYKNGKQWAIDKVRTAGNATALRLTADRKRIVADGNDLSFITVRVADSSGTTVPYNNRLIKFEVSASGEIVATDNGNPADLVSFASKERTAFGGLALVIVRAKPGASGNIMIKAESAGLEPAVINVWAEKKIVTKNTGK